MSLDGFYEGPGNEVDAIWKYHHKDYDHDYSFHYHNMELFRQSSALVLGHRTFGKNFNDHWREVLSDPKAELTELELANHIIPLEKIVVSDTLKQEDLKPEDKTKVIKRNDIYKVIKDLKQEDGKDLLVIGSRTLWKGLLSHDLVDELHITIGPVISGSGTPLFDHQPEIYLKRFDTRIAQGNVTICYKVSRTQE